MGNKNLRKKLADAGIAAPGFALGPDALAARLRQRPATIPNKRRVESRKAARGGTARWQRDA